MLLAVFNDGAMIALSKDRVVASRMPNSWHLGAIFGQGAPSNPKTRCPRKNCLGLAYPDHRWQLHYGRLYALHGARQNCAGRFAIPVSAAACFCAGIVYGLYLTLSSWILYYVATKMNFFEQSCHLPSLNNEARPSST